MYKTLLGEQGKSHVLAEFLIIFDFTVIKKSSIGLGLTRIKLTSLKAQIMAGLHSGSTGDWGCI